MAESKRSSILTLDHRRPLCQTIDLPFIRSLLDRKQRDQTGLFWAEGCRNFYHAVETGRDIAGVAYCRTLISSRQGELALHHLRKKGVRFLELTEDEFLSVSKRIEPQGIGVVVKQSWQRLIEVKPGSNDIWVVLDDPRTPGNLGTILRTCAAVGAKGLMLIGGEADPHDPTAVRASMGAIFHQQITRTSAKSLRGWRMRNPCRVIGTSPSARTQYRRANYKGPLLLMMGNERRGLRERQLALCDEVVRLPMPGNGDSLNLAVATGVMLYEALAQRNA